MRESFLSRFTPSMLTPETLEAIFVQRGALAKKLVEGIHESATSQNKHYYLLIGPRGMGKTHIVSLVYHRVCKDAEARDKLVIAWLREEEWGIASFLDFLLSVLRALVEEQTHGNLADRYHALFEMARADAELEAEKLLRDAVGDKTLLVITENLDETFKGLEEAGQEKLRAYIQNNPFFVILATSQSLFNGVSVRTSPFYGFFEAIHLNEFSFEDAVAMLRNIASHEGDAELATMINSPLGRARIRAVHHLAAGNPRVYVIFAQFLTRDSLNQLVQPLMQTLDDLTPYYQGRMNYLTPQQRKIVEFLCEQRRSAAVGEIARRNFLTHQTTSSQLKKLRDLGYARDHQVGRESYYELREPLMRIALEVKKLRGEPIRLLVQFLQLWYSRVELARQLEALKPEADCEREYLMRAIEACERESEDPRVEACLRDYRMHFEEKAFEKALGVTEELIAIRGYTSDWYMKVRCLYELGHVDAAKRAKEQTLQITPIEAGGWRDRAILLIEEEGKHEEALASCDKALELEPKYTFVWLMRAFCLEQLERYEEALESDEKAMELEPEGLFVWGYRARHLARLERYEEALESYDKALEIDPKGALFWLWRATVLRELGRHDEALLSCDTALKIDPNADVWTLRAILLHRAGQLDEALVSLDRWVQLMPQDPDAWSFRGEVLSALGRHDKALASFDKALELYSNEDSTDGVCFPERSNRAVALMFMGRWEEGARALDDALGRLAKAGGGDSMDVAIVRNMLIRTRDVPVWRRHIALWIELFDKHHLLAALGQGVAESIKRLSIPWITNEAARAWRDVWFELGGYKELALPLSLLDAAVEYRAKPDKRVLLALPIEERKILEPMLRIPKSERTT